MTFSSPIFLFFFLPITLLLYFIAGRNLRNIVLLTASLFFYAWGENVYAVLILLSIISNYCAGLVIDRLRGSPFSKATLFLAVFLNLSLLGTFKYATFVVDNLNYLCGLLHVSPIFINPVHLPIGISFFTFQAMTYIIDVYYGKIPVQKNILHIALYISLFPQLIAGPIIRYRDIARQLVSRTVRIDHIAEGIERFIYGLGKKVLIANSLAVVADQIFAIDTHSLTTGLSWLGIVCFTLQIYFDFSGYSDMAIGLGRILGFQFPENFNYPYISLSIREFWRRWHISLSIWFRDYLYIPLGGNRKGNGRTYLNLLIVFFLCGLWHGASWNFVIWGLLHGLFLVIERAGFEKTINRLTPLIRHSYVILVVTCCWVFFRTDSLPDAIQYLSAMAGFAEGDGRLFHVGMYLNYKSALALIAGIIFSMPVLSAITTGKSFLLSGLSGSSGSSGSPGADSKNGLLLEGTSGFINIATLSAILMASVMSIASGSYNPFIYFRF